MHCPKVWAFDVDGTLIGSIRSDRLRPGAVELLTALGERGVTRVLWSAGGAEYAERMARGHRIEQHFAGFYGKGHRDQAGRFGADHLHPGHEPCTFVDDQPHELSEQRGAGVIAVPQFLGGNPADAGLLAVLDELDHHLA